MKQIKVFRSLVVAFGKAIVICLVLCWSTSQLLAAPFAKVITFKQPDGTPINLWGQGDEFHAVFETLDGYTVVFDQALKGYCYAGLPPGAKELLSTGELVGKAPPAAVGLAKHLRTDPAIVKAQAQAKRRKWEAETGLAKRWNALKALGLERVAAVAGPQPGPPAAPTLGTKVGLCLVIDFDDDPATVPQAEIENFCNGDNYTGSGNNGSVKQYYFDNSNGQLIYSNIVTLYLRIPSATYHLKSWYNDTSKDCGDQGNLLIRDAVQVLKALPNYATEILPTFDALTVDGNNRVIACNVFYAGGNGGVWGKGLWPHSWVLANVGQQELSPGGKSIWQYQISDIGDRLELGTFCHENGHMLCDYPDIYDYDYDSKGGAGVFCLMNSGGHGPNPAQICAYLKYKSGWATVTELASNLSLTASLTASPGAGFNHFYRFAKPGTPTEYFLAENRQRTGRDASLPTSGVAIWHVDELGDHNNQSLVPNSSHQNYEVTLVQADNRWDFENNVNAGDTNDLYYSGNLAAGYANRLSETSLPNANWWDGSVSGMNFFDFSASGATMTFQVQGSGSPIPVIIAPPTNEYVVLDANAQLAVIASGEPPLSYQWRKGGVNLANGGRISGATSDQLVIANVAAADQGSYDVVVSNARGSATSAPPAVLTVVTAPVVVGQPQDVLTNAGSEVVFHVEAVGVPPLSYQWRKDLQPIAGANTATFTIPSAGTNDSGTYSVLVSNGFGSAPSANAILTVRAPISLADALDNVTLTWATSGSALWRGQDEVTSDGIDAAVSGAITDAQESVLRTTVTGPGALSFWWKVSSETGYDFLDLYVDGSLHASISGEVDWHPRSVFVPAGNHLVEWVYAKDGSVSYGLDLGWVDQVSFTPGPPVTLAEALDAPELTWTTFGDAPWFSQPNETHDGVDAAQSGAIFDLESSVLETTVTGPGTLTFWWNVSSELGFDFVDFFIDNNLQDSISGEWGWEQRTFRLVGGSHTLNWMYSKDLDFSDGLDAGWVDQVVFVADNAPPRITRQPVNRSVELGGTAAFTVEAVGSGNLTYQWQKNGSPIGAATSPTYTINSVQASNAGTYAVVVTNPRGSTPSSNAVLTVVAPITLADALDAPALTWLTSGNGLWKGDADTTHDGVDAARSGAITNDQQSRVSTTVIGPGTVTFWWKVSSESGYDYLFFYANGIERARISGNIDWRQRSFSIPSGSQTLEWAYAKDFSVSVGEDAGWVDQVTFGPALTAPTIINPAFAAGTFSASVATTPGRSYQLEFKNSLGDATWTALPAVLGDGTVKPLFDPGATNAQRFYRVLAQ